MTIQEKLAYLAGIIDGEGNIGINLSKKGKWQNCDNYKIRLTISGTDMRLMDWLVENFGGWICAKPIYKKEHKKSYNWSLMCSKAGNILEMVLPYLIIKKQQALIAVSYRKLQTFKKCSYPGKRKYPIGLRQEIYGAFKYLNRRGSKSVETNTLDVNSLLAKIESELDRNIKNRVSDNLVAE